MKVKHIGFGGYMCVPCYEDESGNLYFDENNGEHGLDLYTGAYRDSCGEICGEPIVRVTESIECEKPFMRNPMEFEYQMLSRMQGDCEYFLGYGNACSWYLEGEDINTHCDCMKKCYDSFPAGDKPEWITLEQIEGYRKRMLKKVEEKESKRRER